MKDGFCLSTSITGNMVTLKPRMYPIVNHDNVCYLPFCEIG